MQGPRGEHRVSRRRARGPQFADFEGREGSTTMTMTETLEDQHLHEPELDESGGQDTHRVAPPPPRRQQMSVQVRAACLQDGVAVLGLLEDVGYYPEPIAFAKTYRKTLNDPLFLVRVAEFEGKIVGMASLSLRHQLGLGGLVASLDEFVITPGPHEKGADKALMQATVGRARALGARRIINTRINEGTTPRPAAIARTA